MHSAIGLPARLRRMVFVFLFCCAFSGMLSSFSFALSLGDAEIALLQQQFGQLPLPERIAQWAERFVGTPYDRDPLGEYVRRSVIVADERVDCMYHVFRSVELALASTPEHAIQVALFQRFHRMGMLEAGRVMNYVDRYAYGEDMVLSGKFGREITDRFGLPLRMRGSRGLPEVRYASREMVLQNLGILRPGDILFFVRSVKSRVLDEVIGHIGIVAGGDGPDQDVLFLVHAAGIKGRGGTVKKVVLRSYLATMPFAGVQVTRFE